MKRFLVATALLAAPAGAFAQAVPAAGYEFLTVAELQNQNQAFATLVFAPAFAGQTARPLAPLPGGLNGAKYVATYRHNLELVTQTLAAVTAAGWELVLASAGTPQSGGHEYLFRRPKK